MAVEVQELHCDIPDTYFTFASAAGHPEPGKNMNTCLFVFLSSDNFLDFRAAEY